MEYRSIARSVRSECLQRMEHGNQGKTKECQAAKASAQEPVPEGGTQAAPEQAAGTFPNLKYAEPKYKNIESLMKFVESKGEAGGVKLIIMNFND